MAASTSSFTGEAIVCHGKLQDKGWKLETVVPRAHQPHELVVEMVASGICHTDVIIGSMDPSPLSYYPRVLGHEGAGYVRAIGSAVTTVQIGDPVVLSFFSCKSCHACADEHRPSLCTSFNELNFGPHWVFSAPTSSNSGSASPDLGGKFFGQSSFAHYSIVEEQSVVNVREFVSTKSELQSFAPLGCGIQTGSGTLINVFGAKPSDTVAIVGLGGVGLSGVMGAKIQGAKQVIGIDRVKSRLALAKELGATHLIDTNELAANGKGLVECVREMTGGVGVSLVMEASGVPSLVEAALEFTRNGGRMAQVGAAPPDAKLEVPIAANMMTGKTMMGAVEGNVVPHEYVPKMIGWFREGRLPFDRLVKTYPAKEWERAVEDMLSGETVKPVILWS